MDKLKSTLQHFIGTHKLFISSSLYETIFGDDLIHYIDECSYVIKPDLIDINESIKQLNYINNHTYLGKSIEIQNVIIFLLNSLIFIESDEKTIQKYDELLGKISYQCLDIINEICIPNGGLIPNSEGKIVYDIDMKFVNYTHTKIVELMFAEFSNDNTELNNSKYVIYCNMLHHLILNKYITKDPIEFECFIYIVEFLMGIRNAKCENEHYLIEVK